MAVYQQVCNSCGYVGGLSNIKYGTGHCPSCGGCSLISRVVSETEDERISREKAAASDRRGAIATVAILFGYTFIFFPGAMITMLLNKWVHFEPGWGQWFCGIGMSLLVFLFCGFNWKKYLVLDIILVSICSIIGWLSSFSPWAFTAKTLMPMWFD